MSYNLNAEQLELLTAALKADADERKKILFAFAQDDMESLVEVFAQFVELTKSVEENARGFMECMLCAYGNYTPRSAADTNFPSIEGAIEGAKLARKPAKGMCDSCAFRLGTVPNQCLPTIADANQALGTIAAQFMCHYDLDENEEPVNLCAGFAAARAAEERDVRKA